MEIENQLIFSCLHIFLQCIKRRKYKKLEFVLVINRFLDQNTGHCQNKHTADSTMYRSPMGMSRQFCRLQKLECKPCHILLQFYNYQ